MHHFIYNHIFTQNVTSYAEAFLPVQSDSQTSEKCSYFENNVLDNGGYIMDSLWTDTVNIRSHKPLAHDIKTSVLIIGGGLTGILCAYRLKRLGIPCVIAEAGEICSRTTRCTTAKITAQHGLIYHKLAKRYSLEYARMYLEAGLTALSEYENMCADIDCDFEHRNNYVYSILHRRLAVNICNATANLLKPSRKRCAHLGCALTRNPEEKTWDCPCHGSRFSKDGKVINNPANRNLS